MKKDFPKGWYELIEKMKKRKANEEKVKEEGGDKFEQLTARITDIDSGKLLEDIVIYAIRTTESVKEAEDFYKGYIKNIKNNLNRYPEVAKESPKRYAQYDIQTALDMHFYENKTHKLWRKAMKKRV